MFKINYGYGTGKKKYSTLKGAKIACQAYFKTHQNVNWLDVVEIKTRAINRYGFTNLSTEVIHHIIFRK